VVASEVDVEKEESIASQEEVNQSSYVSFHNGQIFEDGLSFSGNERNKVWINAGDRFADLSDLSGADTPNDSRAVVAADFDDDGDVDLFLHNIQRERHNLYRNDAVEPGVDGGFLKLRLSATTLQYEAIGASVTVQGPAGPTTQVLTRGAGFLSCQVPELVFGLGANEAARVSVQWPGGAREEFGNLRAGTRATLVEGSGEAEPVAARQRRFLDPLPPGLRLDEGDLLPRLTVIGPDGEPTELDVTELAEGRTLLLNLWATYCVGCIKELPLLQRMAAANDDQRILLLSVDVPADAGLAREFLSSRGLSLPAFGLSDGQALPGTKLLTDLVDLDRLKLPTTLILSADGRVEAIQQGPFVESAGESSE